MFRKSSTQASESVCMWERIRDFFFFSSGSHFAAEWNQVWPSETLGSFV